MLLFPLSQFLAFHCSVALKLSIRKYLNRYALNNVQIKQSALFVSLTQPPLPLPKALEWISLFTCQDIVELCSLRFHTLLIQATKQLYLPGVFITHKICQNYDYTSGKMHCRRSNHRGWWKATRIYRLHTSVTLFTYP